MSFAACILISIFVAFGAFAVGYLVGYVEGTRGHDIDSGFTHVHTDAGYTHEWAHDPDKWKQEKNK